MTKKKQCPEPSTLAFETYEELGKALAQLEREGFTRAFSSVQSGWGVERWEDWRPGEHRLVAYHGSGFYSYDNVDDPRWRGILAFVFDQNVPIWASADNWFELVAHDSGGKQISRKAVFPEGVTPTESMWKAALRVFEVESTPSSGVSVTLIETRTKRVLFAHTFG